MPTEFQALTPEQTAALDIYRARWAAIRRSTEPADRAAAEDGVRLAYRAASLQPPSRIVWCQGPVALSQLARRPSRADGANLKSAVIDRIRRSVASRVAQRVHKRVRTAVQAGVNRADTLVASAHDAVMRGAADETPPLMECLRRGDWSLRGLFVLDGFRHRVAGQYELSWLGTYDFFRNELGLRAETEPLLGLWQLARSLGWIGPHEHVCLLVERPGILRSDGRARLHSASGPALRYSDGWCVYAWKGIEVRPWMIEQPERITLAAIDAEPDIQVRRCMIEILTPQRFVALGGAVRVAEDDAGVLWRKAWWASDAWAAVEVINATPEPDGTRQHFFLQVPATMRTAREAVAWTYGLSADAYARLVMRT